MADIRAAIQPRSDQLNYEDFLSGPAVLTIERTEDYRDEKGQPRVAIHMVEYPGRPFKASKTNVKLLAIAWGEDDTDWPGRRVQLSADPTVTYGGKAVGGICVTALSHLPQRFTAKLSVARGKKKDFPVEPLPDAPPQYAEPSPIPAFESLDEARDYYTHRSKAGASPDELQAIIAAAPPAETPTAQENN